MDAASFRLFSSFMERTSLRAWKVMEYMSAKLAKQNVYCTGKQLGNWQAGFVPTRGKIRNKWLKAGKITFWGLLQF